MPKPFATLLLALAALLFAPLVAAVGEPAQPIRPAYFYRPPTDGTSPKTAAQRYGAMILTRGDERYRDDVWRHGFRGPMLQYLLANETSGPPQLQVPSDRCSKYTRGC